MSKRHQPVRWNFTPFRRLGPAVAEQRQAAEAVAPGRLCRPEPCFHPGTPWQVAEADADTAAPPESAFRQSRFASQVPEALSRKPKAQLLLRKEAGLVSLFSPPHGFGRTTFGNVPCSTSEDLATTPLAESGHKSPIANWHKALVFTEPRAQHFST